MLQFKAKRKCWLSIWNTFVGDNYKKSIVASCWECRAHSPNRYHTQTNEGSLHIFLLCGFKQHLYAVGSRLKFTCLLQQKKREHSVHLLLLTNDLFSLKVVNPLTQFLRRTFWCWKISLRSGEKKCQNTIKLTWELIQAIINEGILSQDPADSDIQQISRREEKKHYSAVTFFGQGQSLETTQWN